MEGEAVVVVEGECSGRGGGREQLSWRRERA